MVQVPSPVTPPSSDSTSTARRVPACLVSREACRIALATYERAYHRCTEMDPDIGIDAAFAAGRRALAARGTATAWLLSPERGAAVSRLLEGLDHACEDQVGDWVDRFPRAFLGILERRSMSSVAPDAPRRRFAERRPAPEPVGHPSGAQDLTLAGAAR
jgi:hypothetical protein